MYEANMKWKMKDPEPDPVEGQKRIQKGFLFFPKCLNREWRWLEKAIWIERCERKYGSDMGYLDQVLDLGWRPYAWYKGREEDLNTPQNIIPTVPNIPYFFHPRPNPIVEVVETVGLQVVNPNGLGNIRGPNPLLDAEPVRVREHPRQKFVVD